MNDTREARGDWIQTYTGRQFFPFSPRAEDVCIEDIAHHLAIINRFTGATSMPYSVAEHSIRVARHLRPGQQIYGLLHDAAEAYLNDFARPVKRSLTVRGSQLPVSAIEDLILEVVSAALGVSFRGFVGPEIKAEDLRALATERRDLMAQTPAPWLALEQVQPWHVRITPWPWFETEDKFLQCFRRLRANDPLVYEGDM